MEARWIGKAGTAALPEPEIRSAVGGADGFVWIDLHHTEVAGMELLQELVQVRAEDLADCSTRSPVPKIHIYPDHIFSAINGVARGTDGRLHFQPLKVFLAPELVVTVLGPSHEALTAEACHRELTAVAERLDTGQLRPSTALELVTTIRSQMLRAMEELTGAAARAIVRLEQRVMATDPVRAEVLLRDLVEIRHDLQTIGTNAAQTYESYDQMIITLRSQEGLLPVDVRRIEELRSAFKHLMNTTDLEREYLQEMLDLFQTRASTELNRFVRKITAFGTIGIACTVVTGVYGMNFAHMPELTWRYGYFGVLGLMVVIGLVLVGIFRRSGWL